MITDDRDGSPSPLEERKNSTNRDRFDFDRESMQDMELREEDESMLRGEGELAILN